MSNRYNELSAATAMAIDELVNALASSPDAGISPVHAATIAVRAQRDHSVTLTDGEVRYLAGHMYYQDGIGRSIYDKVNTIISHQMILEEHSI